MEVKQTKVYEDLEHDATYTCLVCGVRMPGGLPFCAKCYKEWKGTQNEPWARSLRNAMQREHRYKKLHDNVSLDAILDGEHFREDEY